MSKTGWYYKGQYLTNYESIAKDLISLGFPLEHKINGEGENKNQNEVFTESGKTLLRDWFATHENANDLNTGMAEFIMGSKEPELLAPSLEYFIWWNEARAKWRYMKADAMLKARGS